MMRLVLHHGDPEGDDILEVIRQLCLAVSVEMSAADDTKLPVLWDDQQAYVGKQAILRFLEEMAQFKQEWDKFQSDTCYCDDEGEVE